MTHNPLSPARDEENRRLAEWIEPIKGLGKPHRFSHAKCWRPDNTGPWDNGSTTLKDFHWEPIDFYTDEAANALLLEDMPAPELYCHPPDHSGPEKGWRCRPDWGLDFAVYHSDRKTAIVKAYIAYREAQK